MHLGPREVTAGRHPRRATAADTLLASGKTGEHFGARNAETPRPSFFFEVRPWFFAIAAFIPPLELADTLLHGGIHRVLVLGPFYIAILIGSEICCIVGAWTSNRRFHAAWASAFFLMMSSWMVARFWAIG